MSETSGAGLPGTPTTLFQHALRLHRLTPDGPLFRSGEPFPGAERRRRQRGQPFDPSRGDADAAKILDAYFLDTRVSPRQLATELLDVPVSSRYDEHISAAALRAPTARVRETGRWLIRHGTGLAPVAVGLALLAEVGTVDDIQLIQTIGLLSNAFGPLAVRALERLPGGVKALFWFAERVTAWGRVHAVDALCRYVDDHPAVRPWLLRRAVDGDHLNGYFAAEVARVTMLHEVIAQCGDDAEVVDHTGRILHVMKHCEGMGTSLRHYPHALVVLEAHVRHIGSLGPTAERYFAAATLAQYLAEEEPAWSDDAALKARWDKARASYLALVHRADWCSTAREGLAAGDWRLTWLADSVALETRSVCLPQRQAESRGTAHVRNT
ncbi:hypothetical protein GCM10010415_66200 [Streptomyces atrovirens]|uniref:Uncharacterized protein n=1 Tax=Streptomyces atrovirens TaxID=285556 RepID=A0ABW0DQH3_9ACTN